MDPRLEADVRDRFAAVFGGEPEGIAVAPGRVNLIGEHTDYNEGYVLPMAIDRDLAVAFRRRGDSRLRIHSRAQDATWESALDALRPSRHAEWSDYVAGVAWALAGAGHRLSGADLAIAGDVPIGAGLSSSAALEVATARAFSAASGLPWDPIAMAQLCQRAENDFVGMACGLMDQFAAACSRDGQALLLDCRTLETQDVPLPESAAVVVMDTGVRRSLARSAYNDRRAACEAAVAALRVAAPHVRALRDVTPELLEAERARLDAVVWKRAAHVVAENRRPLDLARALQEDDLPAAGRLMVESHLSLRDLYEVSSPELDFMVELARTRPACYGARMTGAGFGGCAVALVARDAAESFARDVERDYQQGANPHARCFACRPEGGARLL